MIRYEIILDCSESTAPELERWMRNTHIPDMLETGCFTEIHFDQGDGRFRTVCEATSQADLDRYVAEFAERLREDFKDRFPTGVAVSRDTWVELQDWTMSSAQGEASRESA